MMVPEQLMAALLSWTIQTGQPPAANVKCGLVRIPLDDVRSRIDIGSTPTATSGIRIPTWSTGPDELWRAYVLQLQWCFPGIVMLKSEKRWYWRCDEDEKGRGRELREEAKEPGSYKGQVRTWQATGRAH